jgi:DNA-binding MarR family transcriptional regulator
MDAAFSGARLSLSQHLVLGMLARVGAVSQQELSEQLRIDRSVMVGCIDGLEAAGFVRRERNPHDRRAYAVVPTDAGLAALEDVDRGMAARLDLVFGPLSPSEREQLGGLIRKMLDV